MPLFSHLKYVQSTDEIIPWMWYLLSKKSNSIQSPLMHWVKTALKSSKNHQESSNEKLQFWKDWVSLTIAIFLWFSFSFQKVCKFKATALKLHNRLYHTLDLYLSHLKGNNECALACQATWSMIMQMQDGRKRKKNFYEKKNCQAFIWL